MPNGDVIGAGYNGGEAFIERRGLTDIRPVWRHRGKACGRRIMKARNGFYPRGSDGQLVHVVSRHGHHLYNIETGRIESEAHRDEAYWLHIAATGTYWYQDAQQHWQQKVILATPQVRHGVILVCTDYSFIDKIRSKPFQWIKDGRPSVDNLTYLASLSRLKKSRLFMIHSKAQR